MESFSSKERSLLRDVQVEEDVRIKINTSAGAHVIEEIVIDALKTALSPELLLNGDSMKARMFT